MPKRTMSEDNVSKKKARITGPVEVAIEARIEEAIGATIEAATEAVNARIKAVNARIEAVNAHIEAAAEPTHLTADELVELWGTKTESSDHLCTVEKMLNALTSFDTDTVRKCWYSGIRFEHNPDHVLQLIHRFIPLEGDTTLQSVLLYLLGECGTIKITYYNDKMNWWEDLSKKPRVCPPELAEVFIRDMLKMPHINKSDVGKLCEKFTQRSVVTYPKFEWYLRGNWSRFSDDPDDKDVWKTGEMEAFIRDYKITCAAVARVLCAWQAAN